MTKDADFVNSHLLRDMPAKLLLISTGNISNRDLELLVRPMIPRVMLEFRQHAFLELGRSGIFVRG